AANVARRIRSNGAGGTLCLCLRSGKDGKADSQAAVEGWLLGSYSFSKYKSNDDDKPKSKVKKVTICGTNLSARDFNAAANAGKAIGEAANLARDLINEPPAYMTPSKLAQEAKRVAKECDLTCTVMSVTEVEKLGMGSFLGVARGAKEPAKFIVLRYNPPK